MRWSMDTHKYMSEITRKALQIISAHKLTSESDNQNIKMVERELEEAGVYKTGGGEGRIRRALFTYFKSYYCLDDNENLTEIGKAFINYKITLQEFCFYYILNYKFKENSAEYYPAHLILTCIKKLTDTDAAQNYLSAYDFQRLTECNSLDDLNDEFINGLIKARNESIPEIDERSIGFDVWTKMLTNAGILVKTDEKVLKVMNWPLVNWILDSYSNDLKCIKGKIATGVLVFLPKPILANREYCEKSYTFESKALQAYLFDNIDNDIISKYIFRAAVGSFSEMMEDLCLKSEHKGFYSCFAGLERLVGYSLLSDEDIRIKNLGSVLTSVSLTQEEIEKWKNQERALSSDKSGENIILYGVPGAGKSWTIEHDYGVNENNSERVVFHPDYTYAEFVGQILPKLIKTETGEKKVSYDFVPGPFTKLLKRAYALDNNGEMLFLVIEEINRGNAPAIFGDIFQLLDRVDSLDEKMNPQRLPKGTSVYSITNADMAKEIYGDEKKRIRIPANVTIIATMNTSDQNVFTLDTAFQRRWKMRLIENDFEKVDNTLVIAGTAVSWKVFGTEVNKIILDQNNKMASLEDKRLGTHFVTETELNTIEDFAYKVLKYLWDDAFKYDRSPVFNTEVYSSLDQIIKVFINAGTNEKLNVFNADLRKELVEQSAKLSGS